MKTKPGVKARVKSADKLRRAKEYDASIEVIDDTIRFINASPPTVPNEECDHARNDTVALLLRKSLIHLNTLNFDAAKKSCDEGEKRNVGLRLFFEPAV